jgi:hypothetical protein
MNLRRLCLVGCGIEVFQRFGGAFSSVSFSKSTRRHIPEHLCSHRFENLRSQMNVNQLSKLVSKYVEAKAMRVGVSGIVS